MRLFTILFFFVLLGITYLNDLGVLDHLKAKTEWAKDAETNNLEEESEVEKEYLDHINQAFYVSFSTPTKTLFGIPQQELFEVFVDKDLRPPRA